MKSLKELLAYYHGIRKGVFATTEQNSGVNTRGLSSGRIELGENRKDIDSALLYDADRLTKASVASYLASSQLRLGGHRTWGEITLYYAQFQIINAMLRLVGIAPVDKGRRLLLRTSENDRAYSLVSGKDDEARDIGFTGGGSHKVIWKMYAKYFANWEDPDAPTIATPDLYDVPVWMRNETNYLQSNTGIFFPETDLTGLQEWTIGTARTIGNWDWLRTDDNPLSYEEPPEAYFFAEMMAWDLIMYIVKVLATLEGQYLLDEYIWIIENLDAYDELREHMINDLKSVSAN